MANMMKKSMNTDGEHTSPLGRGNIHEAYAGLDVKILQWPDKEVFERLIYKAVMATRGSDLHSDEIDAQVVEDAFGGGLNQSLEWVNVTFEISGTSRGVTHELVRTRQASYAQQSMRHTDMGLADMRMPEGIVNADPDTQMIWVNSVEEARQTYQELVERDVEFQDARTVLPIATETYIICNYPLKVFMDTFAYRGCYMFYPEIVKLFHRMREALLEVCPWLRKHVLISCEKTAPQTRVLPAGKGVPAGAVVTSLSPITVTYEHACTYQGWERVEGHCPFTWAKEDNRVWKSRVFNS